MEKSIPVENSSELEIFPIDSLRINTKENKYGNIDKAPVDKCYVIHFLFLLFGIMHLLPISFFVTSNDYWMYKFRNTSSTDSNDRSTLQSNFASGSTIAQSVPTVICMIFATVFAYKIKLKKRIVISLSVLVASFAISTGFIRINTEEWQTGFFAITMMTLALMNGILALFQVSTLALLSKFPPAYMKTFLVGQGIGGIFTSALQVLSLALGTSSEASALVYFISGTMMTSFTLALFCVCEKLVFYQFHFKNSLEDTKRDLISYGEFKDISRRIWSSLVIVMAGALAYVPTHPAIAALVVSEFRGNGNPWNEKYFVAVVTFLYSDICSLIGRVIAAWLEKRPSESWLVGLAITRMIIFVPLFMLCNTLPRNHFPIWFPHDWQYIIILGSFMISSGYFFNIAFLNVIKLAPEDEETSYLIMQTFIGVVGAVFSPLGVLCVNLL